MGKGRAWGGICREAHCVLVSFLFPEPHYAVKLQSTSLKKILSLLSYSESMLPEFLITKGILSFTIIICKNKKISNETITENYENILIGLMPY